MRNLTVYAHAVPFHSAHDEAAFFEWLDKLQCVERYFGRGSDIAICLRPDAVDDASLRELLALFVRYDIEDARQLASFETGANRHWFRENVEAFWHAAVFGRDERVE